MRPHILPEDAAPRLDGHHSSLTALLDRATPRTVPRPRSDRLVQVLDVDDVEARDEPLGCVELASDSSTSPSRPDRGRVLLGMERRSLPRACPRPRPAIMSWASRCGTERVVLRQMSTGTSWVSSWSPKPACRCRHRFGWHLTTTTNGTARVATATAVSAVCAVTAMVRLIRQFIDMHFGPL